MVNTSLRLVCLVLLLSLAACQGRRACCPGPVVATTAETAPPTEVAEAVPKPKPTESISNRTPAILARKRVKGLRWDDVSLDVALTYLSTISGLAFKISEKARTEKFDDIRISAQLDDVSLATVLDVVLTSPFDMHWIIKDRVVWLRTNDEIDGPTSLRFYDVKDLVGPLPEPPKNGKPIKAPLPPSAEMEMLVDAIKADVSPGYWERKDATIEPHNGILVVRAAKPVLQRVGGYLSRQRAAVKASTLPKKLQAELEATKITLAFNDTPLPDALKIVMIQTGRNLMIDPRIAHELEKQVISALNVKDVSLMTALTMLKEAAGPDVVWQARGNVLVLTHQEHVSGG